MLKEEEKISMVSPELLGSEVIYKVHCLEPLEDTGFTPIGLDEPYIVISNENPIGSSFR
jgi:hypothetical protein